MKSALLFTALLALAGPASAAELAVTETRLGNLSAGVVGGSLVVSPDGRRLSYAVGGVDIGNAGSTVSGQVRMMVDGQSSASFLALTPAVFSADSKHIAYAGQHAKSGPAPANAPRLNPMDAGWQIFVDGKMVDSGGDEAPGVPAAFSPDGQHVATLLRKDYQWHVTVDGKAWPPIIGTAAGLLSFSPDGKHAALVARVKTGVWSLFLDGAPLPLPDPPPNATGFDRLAGYAWNPATAAIAYQAAYPHKRWQVFATGDKPFASAEADNLVKALPLFSPEGSRLAFAIETQKKWQVLTTTDAGPLLDQLRPDSLSFTLDPADTHRLLYLGQVGKAMHLYIDHADAGLAPFDGITNNTFITSADHRHYAFAGVRGTRAVIVRDGAELLTLAEIGGGTFAFSPDGNHLAFAGRDGANGPTAWHVYVDAKPGAAGFAGMSPTPIAFSPDGKSVAFAALGPGKQWHLVIGINGDGQSKPYEGLLAGSRVWWQDGKAGVITLSHNIPVRVEAPAGAPQ